MADLSSKKSNIASDMIAGADLVMRGVELLEAAHNEATSAGLSFVDDDFAGGNGHLNAADFSNLRNTASQIKTLITAGHLTNLNKARP